jgi:hypothetical protein
MQFEFISRVSVKKAKRLFLENLKQQFGILSNT